jgi:hypothetical protein
VCDNSDSHELLSVVATVHHQGVGETLNDWALCLAESLLCVSASRVRNVDRRSDLDVIAVGESVSSEFEFEYVRSIFLPTGYATSSRISRWESLRQGDIADLNIFIGPESYIH